MVPHLELVESEATASTELKVVLLGLAAHNGPEKSLGGAGGNLGGLLGTSLPAAELPAWLVEPGLDHLLPLLVKVSVGHLVVVGHHFSSCNNERIKYQLPII